MRVRYGGGGGWRWTKPYGEKLAQVSSAGLKKYFHSASSQVETTQRSTAELLRALLERPWTDPPLDGLPPSAIGCLTTFPRSPFSTVCNQGLNQPRAGPSGATEDYILPVTHSQWAAPIISVLKKEGKFRICGDCKVTVN